MLVGGAQLIDAAPAGRTLLDRELSLPGQARILQRPPPGSLGTSPAWAAACARTGSSCPASTSPVSSSVILRGARTKVFLFTLRLSCSGKAVHRAFASQGQESFLEGHALAFTGLGGGADGQDSPGPEGDPAVGLDAVAPEPVPRDAGRRGRGVRGR